MTKMVRHRIRTTLTAISNNSISKTRSMATTTVTMVITANNNHRGARRRRGEQRTITRRTPLACTRQVAAQMVRLGNQAGDSALWDLEMTETAMGFTMKVIWEVTSQVSTQSLRKTGSLNIMRVPLPTSKTVHSRRTSFTASMSSSRSWSSWQFYHWSL